MNETDVSLTLITVPDEDTAKKIAGALISRRLAACVNIIPGITSIYRWDDKIQIDNELLMIVKSHRSLSGEIQRMVTDNHPYDVPEIISVDLSDGNRSYLDWVIREVKRSSDL